MLTTLHSPYIPPLGTHPHFFTQLPITRVFVPAVQVFFFSSRGARLQQLFNCLTLVGIRLARQQQANPACSTWRRYLLNTEVLWYSHTQPYIGTYIHTTIYVHSCRRDSGAQRKREKKENERRKKKKRKACKRTGTKNSASCIAFFENTVSTSCEGEESRSLPSEPNEGDEGYNWTT